jgi:hypothetical protein
MLAAKGMGRAVIGVQVRVGDTVMDPGADTASMELARNHFKCALDIAGDLQAASKTPSVVFLLSDSFSLVHAAMKMYGDWVIADNDTKPVHVSNTCNKGMKCYTRDEKVHLVQQTMNRVILFSLADFHVVSQMSGFGMMGAWMNGQRPIEHRVYRVLDGNIRCSYASYTSVIWKAGELAYGWSGIR